MKRFNFRLQRVLDAKRTIEEVKRSDFLAADNEHKKKIRELKDYYDTLAHYQSELYTLDKSLLEVQILNLYYSYFDALSHRIEYQKGLIETARQEMEKRREKLLEAVKDRKVLENLKQKKYDNYMYEVEKEEQSLLDEISGGKFFQKKAGQYSESLEGI